MASGFVQRYKGRITLAVGGLNIAGVPYAGTAGDLNSVKGSNTLQALTTSSTAYVEQSVNGYGVTSIISGTNAYIFRLGSPAYTGVEKTIQLTAVSTLGVFFTTSTAGGNSLNGSSISNTIKSTQAVILGLLATSTTNWALTSVGNSSAGTITISTTT